MECLPATDWALCQGVMLKAITFGTRSFRDLETSQNTLHFQVTNFMVFKISLGPSGNQSVAKAKLLTQFVTKTFCFLHHQSHSGQKENLGWADCTQVSCMQMAKECFLYCEQKGPVFMQRACQLSPGPWASGPPEVCSSYSSICGLHQWSHSSSESSSALGSLPGSSQTL